MAKFSFCVFITTVLLGITAADWKCIMDAKKPVIPEQFFSEPEVACWDVENKFKRTREKLMQCLDYELDISQLESLFYEFCRRSSDFHEKVPRQLSCISSNILKLFQCSDNLKSSPGPLPFKIRTKSWKNRAVYDSCQRVSSDQSNCSTHKVAGPCGAEGMEVFGRMQVAGEPFLTGACMAIAKHVVEDGQFTDGMAEVEEEDADSSLAEIERNGGCARGEATHHSALTWFVVVGLLLAAKAW